MSGMIIDPPVDVSSPREKLDAWEAELERMRSVHRADPEAVASIELALEEVRHWIRLQNSPPE